MVKADSILKISQNFQANDQILFNSHYIAYIISY